jgi:N utilization substance protein B
LGARRRARELAVQFLYQMEANPLAPHEALESFRQSVSASRQVKEFAARIVAGVQQYREEIDRIIGKYSEHWRLERIDRVDKNILRMGVFELLYCDDIPVKVALNEAIDIGKQFGTEESGAFINGILDKISKMEKSR